MTDKPPPNTRIAAAPNDKLEALTSDAEFSSLGVGSATAMGPSLSEVAPSSEGLPSPRSSSSMGSASSPPAPLSEEALFYYYGLPSSPQLVGRSGTTPWEAPSGFEAYHRPKVLGTVGRHAIKDIWEDRLSPELIKHLDLTKVDWTSIDVVRIGYVEDSCPPVVVWIGVRPGSLSMVAGTQVAQDCHYILKMFGIDDVDVEIRESLVAPLSGPKLLPPAYSLNPTADARNPFTTALGIPISAKGTSWVEGTGGLFIAEGGTSERLFLVTARHVVFEPNGKNNDVFEYESPSTPRHDVVLLGNFAFEKVLDSIEDEIKKSVFMISHQQDRIDYVKGMAGSSAGMERGDAWRELERAKAKEVALKSFFNEVSTHWTGADNRVLGHVIYSPPIVFGFGEEKYTQDFAIIDTELSKIDTAKFKGNMIDLGTKIGSGEFTQKMRANLRDRQAFRYPGDRLLRLKGFITDEEMRSPLTLDENGDPCLIVLKHGHGTGLTVGRANDVRSVVRNYHQEDATSFSLEWAIVSLDKKSRPFADIGDSGAVVADGRGRIGGIITGGAGSTDSKDITYASSINSVMEGIKAKFPSAHIDPVFHV
ncbi:hypothetical protein BDV93DRAFT_520820 [Ceratobasidium sp. AG-I]|nr:hypothetical protein BDV93DRAFT_520820 [Ceratobasidium sp. AG-I]